MILAIAILIFSALKATYSVGDLLGGKKGVTKDEVQASLDTGRSGSARKNRDTDSVSEDSDPKLIGEYEAALAQMVLIFPQQDRDQAGGDERLRGLLKQTIQGVVHGKRGQITLVGEARELVGQFGEKDRKEAFQNFLALRGEKEQLAMQRQTEARANMLYLGGTALATAMLITMLSMVLLLLTIERNTRPE